MYGSRAHAFPGLIVLACIAAFLVVLPPRGTAAAPDLPAPGTLGRLVSWGDAESPTGEPINGFFATDLDGSHAAPLVQWLRPFTDEDDHAGRTDAVISGASVSPDGTRIAAWVRDPDGFVIPGGTPQADQTYPLTGSTGEVMALFDSAGVLLRVVHEIQYLAGDRGQPEVSTFNPITWLDDHRVVVTGSRRIFVGTDAESIQGILKRIDVHDSTAENIVKENGTPRGDFLTDGWAGGGTIVAKSGTRATYVLARGDSDWVELPVAVPGEETNESYFQTAVSPDGQHLAVSYQGPRTEAGTRGLIDVFDRQGDGSWTRRHLDVPNLSTNSLWPKWLPYSDYSQAELLLALEDDSLPERAAAVRVAPGLSPGERVSRTFPGTTGHHAWQPIAVPPAQSGLTDVAVSLADARTTAGVTSTVHARVAVNGPAAATGVRLSVSVGDQPAQSMTVPGGTCSAGTCSIPELAAGQSVEVSFATTPSATGVLPIRVEATSDISEWNLGNNRRVAKLRVSTPVSSPETGRLIQQGPGGGEIRAVDPDGTDPVTLVPARQGEGLTLVEVHPETGLMLWREDTDTGATFKIGSVSGTVVRTFTIAEGDIPLSIAIAPDGRTAYYSDHASETPDRFRVRELRLDQQGAVPVTRLETGSMVPKGIKVSPDGTKLAYLAQPKGDYTWSAVIYDLDFRPPVRVLNTGAFGEVRPNTTPAWSPDSARVALTTGDEGPYGAQGKVVAYPVSDPESPEVVGALDANLWLGQWAPDGEQMIVSDLSTSRILTLATAEVGPPISGQMWWSGQPISGGPSTSPSPSPSTSPSPSSSPSPSTSPSPTTGPVDSTAPSFEFRISPLTFVKPSTLVTLSRVTVSDDTDAANDLAVAVSWGDGTSSVGTGATTAYHHTYATNSRPSVSVTVTDRAGNSAKRLVSTLVVDGTAPTLSVGLPACGRRSSRACAEFRTTRAAWTTIRGAVADTGGSGLEATHAFLVQKRGARWWSYNGKAWTSRSSKSAALTAAKRIVVTRTRSTWSMKASGLSRGTLVITALARDRSGNLREVVRTHKLR